MSLMKQLRKLKIFLKKTILNLNIPLLFNKEERKFFQKNKRFWKKNSVQIKNNKNVIVIFTNISKKIISTENIKLSINAFTEFANNIAIKNTIESL